MVVTAEQPCWGYHTRPNWYYCRTEPTVDSTKSIPHCQDRPLFFRAEQFDQPAIGILERSGDRQKITFAAGSRHAVVVVLALQRVDLVIRRGFRCCGRAGWKKGHATIRRVVHRCFDRHTKRIWQTAGEVGPSNGNLYCAPIHVLFWRRHVDRLRMFGIPEFFQKSSPLLIGLMGSALVRSKILLDGVLQIGGSESLEECL